MATSKRYYWIKLKTDFFDQEAIDFLMGQKNGCAYIVLYQMLCLKTANNNGGMYSTVGEMIVPYDINKIVRDTKYFDFDTVTVALQLFKQLGLIYEEEDNVLKISNFEELVGSETDWAEKKRIYRENHKELPECGQSKGQIEDNVREDIEIRDKSKSKDINKEQNKKENNKEKDDVVVDEGLSRVIKLYERIISNFPTSRATELLKGYTEELGADVVCHAIEIAADNNVRKWAYIEKILQDYSRNNFTTLEQVKLNEQLREEERRRMQSGNAGRNYRSNGGTVQPKKDFSQYSLDDDLF